MKFSGIDDCRFSQFHVAVCRLDHARVERNIACRKISLSVLLITISQIVKVLIKPLSILLVLRVSFYLYASIVNILIVFITISLIILANFCV